MWPCKFQFRTQIHCFQVILEGPKFFETRSHRCVHIIYTLPKTNIAPENRPSQKETGTPNHPFSGAMFVSGRVVICVNHINSYTKLMPHNASDLRTLGRIFPEQDNNSTTPMDSYMVYLIAFGYKLWLMSQAKNPVVLVNMYIYIYLNIHMN